MFMIFSACLNYTEFVTVDISRPHLHWIFMEQLLTKKKYKMEIRKKLRVKDGI